MGRDFSDLDTSCFEVIEGDENGRKNILRRLRNSIAHGDYNFLSGNYIEFTDINPKDNRDVAKYKVSMSDFGTFINNCLFQKGIVF